MTRLIKPSKLFRIFAEALIQAAQFVLWSVVLFAILYVLFFTGSDLSQFRYTGF